MGIDGCFTSYVVVPARSLLVVPEGISAPVAAVATDAATTPWHAVAISALPQNKGATVVVIGIGGLGVNCIAAAKHFGAGVLIGVDVRPESLTLALEAGADHAVKGEDLASLLRKHNLQGVDVVFDCVGAKATTLLAVQSLKKGGHLQFIGLFEPVVQIEASSFINKELTVYAPCPEF